MASPAQPDPSAALGARAKDLFLDALDLDVAERGAFLERACAGDTDLRRRVDALLGAHEEAPRVLGSGTSTWSPAGEIPAGAAHFVDLDLKPGDRVGPYVLESVLGEGGFGTVFLASQERPVQRRVALKVVKLGMDTKAVIGRFEAERQALALMDHPHIARVYDAGATEGGRPYFVMEYVDGEPITDYVTRRRPGLRERLELFVTVCHAIQHAHQRGIIHRDVKPSNVMVGEVDGRPAPKVIDFGVAKATEQGRLAGSFVTHDGLVIGTPAYMSPEQAEGSADLDTRTDVYSLGVLLYELLAGSPPFDARAMGFPAFLLAIREKDPPRPSSRLREHREDPQADQRSTPPVAAIPRDLDWIALRCLEKDRARRYPTCWALASDVQRFLDHRPVEAAPPGAGYRLAKLVRRHRVATFAVIAFALALLAGIAGTSWGLVRARHAANEAARQERVARAVNEFLTEDLLHAAEPSVERGRGRDVSMREVLDAAAEKIEGAGDPGGRFEGAPEVEAAVRYAIGTTYFGLGLFASAEPHVLAALELNRRVYGPDHNRTLVALGTRGSILRALGRYEDALEVLGEALAARRRLGEEATPHVLSLIQLIASTRRRLGDYEGSLELYREALELSTAAHGPEGEPTIDVLGGLAITCAVSGRYDEAGELFERVYDAMRRLHGPDDPRVLAAAANLAAFHQNRERYDLAEPLLRDVYQRQQRIMGPEHTDTRVTQVNLAALLLERERYDEAEALLLDLIEVHVRLLGEGHLDTLHARTLLGRLYDESGRQEEAEALLVDVIEIGRREHGPTHPRVLSACTDLMSVYKNLGRLDEFGELSHSVLEDQRRVLGPAHPNTIRAYRNWSLYLKEVGRLEEAAEALETGWGLAREHLGDDALDTRLARANLAEVYRLLDREADAEALEALEAP